MSEIAKAFIKAQSEMRTPKKGNSNPFFKSKYADLNSVLEAVLEALHNNGIAILQPTVFIDGKSFVNTVLLHESGERLEGFTEILFSKPNDAQAQGSGITYARRYGLQSICGVGAEDDDGNKATQPKKESPELVAENKRKEEERRFQIQLDLDSAGSVDELGEKYTKLNGSDKVVFKEYVKNLKEKLTPKK